MLPFIYGALKGSPQVSHNVFPTSVMLQKCAPGTSIGEEGWQAERMHGQAFQRVQHGWRQVALPRALRPAQQQPRLQRLNRRARPHACFEANGNSVPICMWHA